eukprot:Nk52_evm11s2152 gene=Nk52_evmTU11s2152
MSSMRVFTSRVVPSAARVARQEAHAVAQPSNIQALRAKEQGAWSSLSVEDKVSLYKATYGLSRAQKMKSDPAQSRFVFGATLMAVGAGVGLFGLTRVAFGNQEMPASFTPEWKEATKEKLLANNANPIFGISSKK